MIGDFILFLKRVKNENFCIHDYKSKKFYSDSRRVECCKCGRIRRYEP